jgi:two-component system response regulator PilR (NtrC family)
LSVIPVQVPPLRERPDDIELLANHFLKKYSPAAGKSIRSLTAQSLEDLRDYDWPGNVRQLENTIERAVALEMTEELHVEIPTERQKNKPNAAAAAAGAGGNGMVTVPANGIDMEAYVADLERSLLQQALKQSDGVQTRAAELLKLSYRSFRHLMKKYDL